MPELPEVEVTKLGLAPLINGTVYNVEVRNFSLRWPVNPNLKKILNSQKLISLSRRGKYLLASFFKWVSNYPPWNVWKNIYRI